MRTLTAMTVMTVEVKGTTQQYFMHFNYCNMFVINTPEMHKLSLLYCLAGCIPIFSQRVNRNEGFWCSQCLLFIEQEICYFSTLTILCFLLLQHSIHQRTAIVLFCLTLFVVSFSFHLHVFSLHWITAWIVFQINKVFEWMATVHGLWCKLSLA